MNFSEGQVYQGVKLRKSEQEDEVDIRSGTEWLSEETPTRFKQKEMKMSRHALLVFAIFLVTLPSWAGELDFLLTPDPSDDVQVLGHVMNDFFKPNPGDLSKLYKSFPDPGDVLAPALFLSSQFGKDLSRIVDLRVGGRSWNDIFIHFGVSPQVIFVDLPRKPGPPYGKAWGHWSKHGGDKHGKPFVLSDREFVNWISLRVTSEYFQLDPFNVAGMRSGGKSFNQIIGGQYREKHKVKKSHKDTSSAHEKQGKDKSKENKGMGKGKHKK